MMSSWGGCVRMTHQLIIFYWALGCSAEQPQSTKSKHITEIKAFMKSDCQQCEKDSDCGGQYHVPNLASCEKRCCKMRIVLDPEPWAWNAYEPPRCAGRIFIDLGANCGNTYPFLAEKHFPGGNKSWIKHFDSFYLWEVHPLLLRVYLLELAKEDPRVKIVPHAAWIRDENVTFFFDKRGDHISDADMRRKHRCDAASIYGAPLALGMSSMSNTTILSSKEPTNVLALDFTKWFWQQHFAKNLCYLWLKIDIEGAEYQLIPQLLKTKLACVVDRISIEWHDYKSWMGPQFQKPWMQVMHQNFMAAFHEVCPTKRVIIEEWA